MSKHYLNPEEQFLTPTSFPKDANITYDSSTEFLQKNSNINIDNKVYQTRDEFYDTTEIGENGLANNYKFRLESSNYVNTDSILLSLPILQTKYTTDKFGVTTNLRFGDYAMLNIFRKFRVLVNNVPIGRTFQESPIGMKFCMRDFPKSRWNSNIISTIGAHFSYDYTNMKSTILTTDQFFKPDELLGWNFMIGNDYYSDQENPPKKTINNKQYSYSQRYIKLTIPLAAIHPFFQASQVLPPNTVIALELEFNNDEEIINHQPDEDEDEDDFADFMTIKLYDRPRVLLQSMILSPEVAKSIESQRAAKHLLYNYISLDAYVTPITNSLQDRYECNIGFNQNAPTEISIGFYSDFDTWRLSQSDWPNRYFANALTGVNKGQERNPLERLTVELNGVILYELDHKQLNYVNENIMITQLNYVTEYFNERKQALSNTSYFPTSDSSRASAFNAISMDQSYINTPFSIRIPPIPLDKNMMSITQMYNVIPRLVFKFQKGLNLKFPISLIACKKNLEQVTIDSLNKTSCYQYPMLVGKNEYLLSVTNSQ